MDKLRTQRDPLEPNGIRCARVEMFSNHSRDRGSTMNITTYASRFQFGVELCI